MKKILLLTMLASIISMSMHADNYSHSCVYSTPSYGDTYYIDRKIAEHRAQNDDPNCTGILTRLGYAYNYDAFTYGASLFYQWGRITGVTVGFDGYHIPNRLIERTFTDTNIPTDTIDSHLFGMPLWNLRAGFMITKYFLFGAMMGKSNVGDTDRLVNLKHNQWFVDNYQNNFMFGGFITFVLPISKHVGVNLDFAVTNKTGFNVGIGVNGTIPIK